MNLTKTSPFLRILVGLALLLPAACSRSSPDPDPGCMPGTHDLQLVMGSQVRSYRLHVPPAYDSVKPAPLVIGLHGQGGDPAGFEAYSGLSLLADEAGFLVVYPQGLGDLAGWDTWQNSDDVLFMRALLTELEIRCAIDPRLIYASGHSRGGGMANRLACDLSDRIAAIAPVSGTYQFGEICSPVRPVPVIAFHGQDDPVVPYNGIGSLDQPPEAYFVIGTPMSYGLTHFFQQVLVHRGSLEV